jgi:hypothetical protein
VQISYIIGITSRANPTSRQATVSDHPRGVGRTRGMRVQPQETIPEPAAVEGAYVPSLRGKAASSSRRREDRRGSLRVGHVAGALTRRREWPR